MGHSPGASTPEPMATATATSTPLPTATPTLSPTAVPSPTSSPVPETTEDVVRRITEQVSGLRGLAMVQDTPTFFISSEQMAENIRQSIDEEYTQEEADIEAELLALLDFIEPGTDLKEVFTDLYAGSVVGYYDTDTGEMFVLSDARQARPSGKAHAGARNSPRTPGPDLRPGCIPAGGRGERRPGSGEGGAGGG